MRQHPGFRRFWAASTVSAFGTYVTSLAIGVLVVVDLDGSAIDVGWVNAARWAPYLVLGLVTGVLADRVRRKPLLVATDLGRAVVIGSVPALALTGRLGVGSLVVLLLVFGALSVANDAAHQSFLPRLLPRAALPRANTRLQQSDAVAQTSGPLLAGGLVAWLGAPVAVLVDAVSYLVSGLLILTTPLDDPRPPRSVRSATAVLAELREGLQWVYRHPTLRPLALSTHAWFVFNGLLGTVYVPYALLELDVGAVGLGVTQALAGVGVLLGTGASARIGRRLGLAGTLTGGRLVQAAGFTVVALLPAVWAPGTAGVVAAAGLGQFLFGFGLGAEGPFGLSYRQAVTPARLQGRMNATMRSLNRAAIVVGAPLGGVLAGVASSRSALVIGAAGIAVTALALRLSGFRRAAMTDPAIAD
nr:MFS transporter [Modestobacter sp. DSM 44400]